MEYTKIKKMLHGGTPAITRIAILDSCFSGRAIGLASIDTQLADLSATAGAYTLTAADDVAHVAPLFQQSHVCTTFTGELLELVRSGVPGGPDELTLAAIYTQLKFRLSAKGMPPPNQRSDDNAAQFPFARNCHTIYRPNPQAMDITRPRTWPSSTVPADSSELEPLRQRPTAPKEHGSSLAGPLAPARIVNATLCLEDGSNRTYCLKEGSNIIGRGQHADFRIPDTGVARRHLDITWNGHTARLADLDSTNGTTVNETAVQTWQLAHGDTIRIGHTSVAFRLHQPPDAST